MGFGDLHRHDECSTFDGFGKPEELAKLAAEIGNTSLGITNHGNTNSLVRHYYACKDNGIIPILGVEGYMLPVYKQQERGYHLCLFAKDAKGYENINTIQYLGEKQKYYNPIWDFKILSEHSEGVICTSACVAGYMSQSIIKGKTESAKKFAKKMVEIFGCDFYIEIQPYKIDEEETQQKVNVALIEIAEELHIKCILTSDSHRGRKDDFDTYLKMHEIAKHDLEWIENTYKERYMPTGKEIYKRFCKMHVSDFGKNRVIALGKEMLANIEEIEVKVDENMFDGFTEDLPVFDKDKNSKKLLIEHVKQGLKDRGKYNKKYIERAKMELDTIFYLHFEDYFLMVEDYIKWAKQQGIYVGPGRGSCCNYIVNYALKITEVDSIKFDLEPNRFLMKERKKMPDIDIDFETARRGEVIDYLLKKYKGHSARICSYGLYKVDNLINDLATVCGLPTTGKDITSEEAKANKSEIASIKKFINSFMDEGFLDLDGLAKTNEAKMYNKHYDDIIKHFCKMYDKVRYIGTHAAGVAITGENILERTALRIDSKTGDVYTNYDLNDMEKVMVIKFDMLGLSTMSEIGECRKLTGIPDFQEEMLTDEETIKAFSDGRCDGVFQLDKKSVQQLLVDIHTNCFNDVVAATAMNRPGPLQQKMPELYAANKELYESGEEVEDSYFDEYLGKTYGTIIYQEQIMKMAVEIGGMSWDEAHKITKMKLGVSKFNDYFENEYPKYEKNFVAGCVQRGIPADIAKETFKKFYYYSFNEGHSVGYTLVSTEQMYYKVHYPVIFWFSKMKYAKNDTNFYKFCCNAARDGAVIFLPHVNYSVEKTSIRKVDGEMCLQQGLADIKGVGEKAANAIMRERKENGIFVNYDNFYDRCTGYKGSPVNKGVIEKLKEAGALEFKKKTYISRVTQYNASLYSR